MEASRKALQRATSHAHGIRAMARHVDSAGYGTQRQRKELWRLSAHSLAWLQRAKMNPAQRFELVEMIRVAFRKAQALRAEILFLERAPLE